MMKSCLRSILVAQRPLVAAAFLAVAPGLLAADYIWNNPSGGSFGTGSNWNHNAVPGTEDTIDFSTSGYSTPYTITADGHYTVSRINSSAGQSTILDLRNSGGADYTLTTSWFMPTDGRLEMRGGSITISDVAYIGNGGTGHVTFNDGATVSYLASATRLGGNSNSAGNSLTVSDGSSLTTASIGMFEMGTIAAAGSGTVGNNTMTATGSLSTITISNAFYQGGLSDNNTVSVLAGGKLELNSGFFLGVSTNESLNPTNSRGNKLIVDGIGSAVVKNSSSFILVGALDNTNSSENEITVSNSGSFASSAMVLFYDRQGKIEVTQGGEVTLSNTVNEVYGSIVVEDGGSFTAAGLKLMDSSRVSLAGGAFEIEGDLSINLAGARFSFNLEEPATANIDGTLTLLGSTFIDIFGEVNEGRYTLFTYGNSTQTSLDQFALGHINEGYTATFSFENNSVILNYQSIPEPHTFMLLVFALGGISLACRQRSQRAARV